MSTPDISVEPLGFWRYQIRIVWPADEMYQGFAYEDRRFGLRRAHKHARQIVWLPWCRPLQLQAPTTASLELAIKEAEWTI